MYHAVPAYTIPPFHNLNWTKGGWGIQLILGFFEGLGKPCEPLTVQYSQQFFCFVNSDPVIW